MTNRNEEGKGPETGTDGSVKTAQSASGNSGADPQKEVCCRDPQCRALVACNRHRCDFPGAGA